MMSSGTGATCRVRSTSSRWPASRSGSAMPRPEFVAPAPLHRQRRSEAGAGVDDGGATDRPADGQHHRRTAQRDGGPRAAVQPGVPVYRVGAAELLDRPAPALLEHDDVQARPRQGAGRHRATGAGPDDHGVGGDDGRAFGGRGDGQGRVGPRHVVLLGPGEQLRRIGVGAVGQQHDHLHGLDGGAGVGAERGHPPQHLVALARAEPGQRPAGGEVARRADRQQPGAQRQPRGRRHPRQITVDAIDQHSR